MKKTFRHKWIKITAAALSLSLLAAALAILLGGRAGPLRSWGETASRPFLALFSGVSDKSAQIAAYFSGVDALRAENAALRQQIEALEQEAALGHLARGENQRLRSLLGFRPADQGLALEPAQVIARTPDNWQKTVTLDKGSDHGVQAGQCVVDEAGALVGRVKETGAGWCTLALLCDPSFQLAGLGSNSGVLGALQGDVEGLSRGELTFAGMTTSDPIQAGEEVVTFAAQESYPSGLLVGTITSLEEDPGGLTRTGRVTPAADLDGLRQVFVVTDFWEDH